MYAYFANLSSKPIYKKSCLKPNLGIRTPVVAEDEVEAEADVEVFNFIFNNIMQQEAEEGGIDVYLLCI